MDNEKEVPYTEKNMNNMDREALSREIEVWERNHKSSFHNKSKSIETKKKLKLPNLITNNDRANDFETKYSPNKEQLFKVFKKDIYVDETLRKLITRYSKFSNNQNENNEGELNSDSVEPLTESLELIQKEIQDFFLLKPVNYTTIIEKALFYEQHRTRLDKKLLRRIRNSEAFIFGKQANIRIFRKECSYITEKMSRIKHLVCFFIFTKRIKK